MSLIKRNINYLILLVRRYYFSLRYSKLSLGKNVVLERDVHLINNGKIEIGANSIIRRWVVLNPWRGFISIGENCHINSFCHISGNGGVVIGNNVLIATQCVLISANHNFDKINLPICKQGETKKKIILEDDVWLGAGVKVLAGVTICTGSVIGAGSVVTRDIPPYSVCIGSPARVIKTRNINDEIDDISYFKEVNDEK